MYTIQQYRVAEHLFEIGIDTDSTLQERMQESYSPFQVEDASGNCLFRLMIVDNLGAVNPTLVYSNKDNVDLGYIAMNIYKDENGQYLFEFINPELNQTNASLWISNNYKEAKIALAGTDTQQWYAFNLGVNFCYLLAAARLSTVLCHASCVMYQNKAWLFLGKSGTGKSTPIQPANFIILAIDIIVSKLCISPLVSSQNTRCTLRQKH